MIIPNQLNKGDKIAIISLSAGIIGEPFIAHQRNLIETRLKEMGLEPVYTPNCLKGSNFIKNNPKARIEDLKWAFQNKEVKAIISAIGGKDGYKTVPFILDDEDLKEIIKNNPKIFIGFSDTTIHHLALYKLGLTTYYGHSALVDFGELANEMLPYSKTWFEKLFTIENPIEITSSSVWYHERTSFGDEEKGKDRITKKEEHGLEVLNGTGIVQGELIGGCLESFSDLITGDESEEEKATNQKYNLIPNKEELKGKILFLETSEEQPNKERMEYLLSNLEKEGIFENTNGIIASKPQDEANYNDIKEIYTNLAKKYNLPIIYNVNFGHSHPKCILPYGAKVTLDLDNKKIIINEPLTKEIKYQERM